MNIFTIIGIASTVVMVSIASIILLIVSYIVWERSLSRLSDYFYDKNNVTKMRISGILIAIKRVDFHKIPDVWDEAKEMVEENE